MKKFFNYLIFLLIIVIWFGGLSCSAVHKVTVPAKTNSQITIDDEIEKVNVQNEAIRKLAAAGCPISAFQLVNPYIDSDDSFMEYQCRLNSGVLVKMVKINGRWRIHRR